MGSHTTPSAAVRAGMLSMARGPELFTCAWGGAFLPAFSDTFARAWLSQQERACCKAFPAPARQSSFLAGRMAAKAALSLITPYHPPQQISLLPGIFGFPVIHAEAPMPPLQASISHSGAFALAVVSPQEHPLAIDLEAVDSAQTPAIRSQMAEADLRLLARQGMLDDAGLTWAWTAKEALSKALRTGMMLDFSLMAFSDLVREEETGLLTGLFAHFGQYRAVGGVVGRWAYSLVLPQRSEFPAIHLHHALAQLLLLAPDGR